MPLVRKTVTTQRWKFKGFRLAGNYSGMKSFPYLNPGEIRNVPVKSR